MSKTINNGLVALTLCALSAALGLAQTGDTTAPLLTAFSFTPSSVDVSSGGQNVVVTARITDDLSGFAFGFVQFISPGGQASRVSVFLQTSGTALNGDYSATAFIPPFVEAGTWQPQVWLSDSAGNQRYLDSGTLQALGFLTDLAVADASPDFSPPTVIRAAFSPSSIDVSSGNLPVTLTLDITDSPSGVDDLFGIDVALSPPGATSVTHRIPAGSFSLIAGTPQNGTWQAVTVIPRYSPAGAWQIQQITLLDAASNSITMDNAKLAAAGISPVLSVSSTPSDTAPPTLKGLTFSRLLLNTSAGTQSVVLGVSASDTLSGVDFSPVNGFYFTSFFFSSPSGGQGVSGDPFAAPTLVAGGPLAGKWQMTASWPQFSEEGTWHLEYVLLQDAAGNHTFYDAGMLAAMGFPNAIIVTKPSLTPDGTVSPGGTVSDNSFGSRASVTFPTSPPDIVPAGTRVSIDVFASPLAVPTPRGFTMPGTYFVNLSFAPIPASPLRSPGITVVLPLLTQMTPGASLSLYHIDPVTGALAPAMDASHNFVVGAVDPGGVSATFLNVVTLSTVVAYLSNGSVLGDVNGDGKVTCADVYLVKASFGKRTGQHGFNSAADLNNDHVVDIRDLTLVARQLPPNTHCP